MERPRVARRRYDKEMNRSHKSSKAKDRNCAEVMGTGREKSGLEKHGKRVGLKGMEWDWSSEEMMAGQENRRAKN